MVEVLFAERLINEVAVFGLAAHVIDALVDGDSVEPAIKLRSLLKSGELLIRFEEYLLREVERIVGVGNNGTDHALDPVAVAAVKQIECAESARLETGYEGRIRGRVYRLK